MQISQSDAEREASDRSAGAGSDIRSIGRDEQMHEYGEHSHLGDEQLAGAMAEENAIAAHSHDNDGQLPHWQDQVRCRVHMQALDL